MICNAKWLCILLASLFLCLSPLYSQESTSPVQTVIYESELNSLKVNLLKLELISKVLYEQVASLKISSNSLQKQLNDLNEQRLILEKQITDLEIESKSLKEQYKDSLTALQKLKEQLESLQSQYATLSESFKQYQIAVSKEINKLKLQNMILIGTSSVGGALSILFAVLYLIEKL